jgi:hypothetical protein
MKVVAAVLCLGLSIGNHVVHAQSGYLGGFSGGNFSSTYDPNMPEGDIFYNVALANMRIDFRP